MNKTLGSRIYNNFVPNYKNIATISQIFNDQTPIKDKILLEKTIIENIIIVEKAENNLQPVDKLLYKTFANKFNEKYSTLLSEQKELLSKYVNSFSDDGLELKIYLNEEIGRLKEAINKSFSSEELKSDKGMQEKTKQVEKILNDFKEAKKISSEMLEKIIKIQQYVYEVNN